MHLTRSHLYHHGRFYAALAVGVFVYAMFRIFGGPQPLAASGDAFFVVYLAGALGVLLGHTPEDLKRRAARQDEGILIVVAIALVVIAVNVAGVFHALNSGKLDTLSLTLVLAGAPLGWFVLHTIATFHYANMFYFDPPGRHAPGTALDFPGTKMPDLWDFAYFSFVVGMTAQVSDVEVCDSDMRRAVTAHGIVSFFFNTVLIALVVNAVAGR
ncbi:DUF1345 domain-containing protein [Rhizomicrobium electricum]|jgi:uncharacterized membrane protein|uniref:DUF1345 domain-containing protein n=1 Tax=Rhizomicrobium electricum TaxID=480070 RepID=A0ABN1EP50_9PROT|nr:DUF1345 domain-containing protein [Rhizomicrobium electricum]NIJ48797.1 putative membrane protein [Rhizomicrobium electricum]